MFLKIEGAVKSKERLGIDVYFEELCEAASKVGVEIREDNLLVAGVKAEGGYCWYRGQNLILLEKTLPPRKKFELLKNILEDARCDLENVFLSPALRKLLGQTANGG